MGAVRGVPDTTGRADRRAARRSSRFCSFATFAGLSTTFSLSPPTAGTPMPKKRETTPGPLCCNAAIACGSRRAKFASRPKMAIVTTSEVPPAEIIGSVSPVTGSRPIT